MISYSCSFLFRTKCKYCFTPATRFRRYSSFNLPGKDIIENLKEKSKYKSLDFLPIEGIEDLLRFRSTDKIKIIYFSFFLDYQVSAGYHRKNKKNIIRDYDKMPKFASCSCGQTYWLHYYFDDVNVFPENNRKTPLKFSLKPIYFKK